MDVQEMIQMIKLQFNVSIGDSLGQMLENSHERGQLLKEASDLFSNTEKDTTRYQDICNGNELFIADLYKASLNQIKTKLKEEQKFLVLLKDIIESKNKNKVKLIHCFFKLLNQLYITIYQWVECMIENPGPAGPFYDVDHVVESTYPKITLRDSVFSFSNNYDTWNYNEYKFKF